jgi:hypothetical protein
MTMAVAALARSEAISAAAAPISARRGRRLRIVPRATRASAASRLHALLVVRVDTGNLRRAALLTDLRQDRLERFEAPSRQGNVRAFGCECLRHRRSDRPAGAIHDRRLALE